MALSKNLPVIQGSRGTATGVITPAHFGETSPPNSFLGTNSTGVVEWLPVSGVSGEPGGSPGAIQYNNSGMFGGVTIGSGLTLISGTLAASGGSGAPTSVLTNDNETGSYPSSVPILGSGLASIVIDTSSPPTATATNPNNIAIGSGARSTGTNFSVAIGATAIAAGNYSVAVGGEGYANNAANDFDVCVGLNSTSGAGGERNVAIGSCNISAGGGHAVAIGDGVSITGGLAVAIGAEAVANGNNTVVLGNGSTDGGDPNVFSVGGLGSYRDIINEAHLIGAAGTPTAVVGTGAGSGASATITGNDIAGTVEIVTAGTPAGSNAVIVTLTFVGPNAFPVAPYVALTPANAVTAALTAVTQVFPTSTTTTWVLNSGTSGLTTATTYLWNYHVIG